MKINTLDPNCFLEGCNTYVTWAERIDCVCLSQREPAGCSAFQNLTRKICGKMLDQDLSKSGLGILTPASSRPSSLSPIRTRLHITLSPCGSSPTRTQNWSLCTESRTIVNFETVSATTQIFSGALSRHRIAKFVFLCHVVPHIGGVGILKKMCRRTHARQQWSRFVNILRRTLPTLKCVLYCRKRTRVLWTQFTFHLINLFQFSKKVTFPRSNFMILKFA